MTFRNKWTKSVFRLVRDTLFPRFAATVQAMAVAVSDIGGSPNHDVDMVFLRQKILHADFQEAAQHDAPLKTLRATLAEIAAETGTPIRSRSFDRKDNRGMISIHIDCSDSNSAKIGDGITITVLQGKSALPTIIPFTEYVAGKTNEAQTLIKLIGKWSPPVRRQITPDGLTQ